MIEFINLTSKPIRREVFKTLYRAALPRGFELSVVFAPPALMKKLNKTYRGKNKTTNVLSFSFGKNQGEVFLSASEENLPYLFVHGCLHLQGHDHQTNKEARRMKQKEREILKKAE